ncbi:MAG TPA: hypothetical protein VMH04_06075 [Candidatus Solibacter sp.]|nr:hypothetical protein [Candidatus Solibacter sp.]
MLRLKLRLLTLSIILVAASLTAARDKTETWVQVTSPHFVVVTNSNEKQARRIADQFERMRSVFHVAFPKVQMDPGSPIIVIAVKDDKEFRALEPQAYLAKGSLKLGGLFLRTPDKNYVLMRLDAEGDHPYSVVYHEYTHLLLSKSAEWMPLWLNEGLAEFYQNTDIHEKDAALGEPSGDNIEWLRQNRLIPLETLFAVDQNSPYYHQENKGSIFYAESWALVHFIQVNDFKEKSQRLVDYSTLLQQKVDPVTAATRAFGDLKKLQYQLEGYVRQGSFSYFKMATTTEVDDSAFKAQVLPGPQADAVRADFLAYNERFSDAQALLDHILQEDPNNVPAHETKGLLEFRQGHLEDARKWYGQAVQLDSQSYLAHYYYAAISMNSSSGQSEQAQVENSLRAATKLNPSFAPAFDRLAVFLAMQTKDLDEAHMMGLTAVSLDPANIGYRVNVANILMQMRRGQDAVSVLRFATKLAKTPQESQMIDNMLMRAQEYAERQKRYADEEKVFASNGEDHGSTVTTTVESSAPVPRLKRRDFVAKGPHRFVTGVLKGVHCDNPGLDLTVTANGKDLSLHTDNYFKLPFSTLGFQPKGDLNPCLELDKRPAKVEYVESADPAVAAQLISVELHK